MEEVSSLFSGVNKTVVFLEMRIMFEVLIDMDLIVNKETFLENDNFGVSDHSRFG
jgi:hypothetical protein